MYIWIKVEPQQEHDQHTYVGQGNGAKRNLGTWIAVRCNDWKIHIKGTPKHANTYRWSKMKCKLVYVHRTNKRDSGIGEHRYNRNHIEQFSPEEITFLFAVVLKRT